MWTDSNRDAWLCKSNFSLIFKIRNIQAWLDAEMRKATLDGIAIKSKMEDRDEISEDEVAL